jgi:cytochrome c-type biogenesis protein CcmH
MKGTFLAIAALMSVCAATAVAWPLLRVRGNRLAGALAAALVVTAAAALYPLWSNWDWHAAPAPSAPVGSPEIAAMVAKLEAHLRDEPGDLKGWLMLGRSYVALQRLDDAVDAYDKAERLGDGKNLDAILGFGEALSLRAGGDITPEVGKLFEQGVALAPTDARALLYGGFAAAVRGDVALARKRWLAVKAQDPPPQIMQMIDQRLAELGPDNDNAQPAVAVSAATATVRLGISPQLKARLRTGAPIFLFARAPGSSGPPLAVKRLGADAIGTQVQLSAADSMTPGRALAMGQTVSITARVAFGGQPTPSSGDLYGDLNYLVGHDGVRDLVIDKVTP